MTSAKPQQFGPWPLGLRLRGDDTGDCTGMTRLECESAHPGGFVG